MQQTVLMPTHREHGNTFRLYSRRCRVLCRPFSLDTTRISERRRIWAGYGAKDEPRFAFLTHVTNHRGRTGGASGGRSNKKKKAGTSTNGTPAENSSIITRTDVIDFSKRNHCATPVPVVPGPLCCVGLDVKERETRMGLDVDFN